MVVNFLVYTTKIRGLVSQKNHGILTYSITFYATFNMGSVKEKTVPFPCWLLT